MTNMEFPIWCNTDKLRQGEYGEMLVKQYFESIGFIVVKNPNRFGSWDLIVIDPQTGDAKKVQVKTVSRYVTKKYFGLTLGKRGDTEEALKSCDWLILVVRTPPSFHDKEYEGKMLLVKNHRSYNVVGNQYIIPSDEDNFVLITKLKAKQLKELNTFNP